jgi:hypothetical protein
MHAARLSRSLQMLGRAIDASYTCHVDDVAVRGAAWEFVETVGSESTGNGLSEGRSSNRRAAQRLPRKIAAGDDVREMREAWVHSKCPSGPTHHGPRNRESGLVRQYN